jgi:hypothetical protein
MCERVSPLASPRTEARRRHPQSRTTGTRRIAGGGRVSDPRAGLVAALQALQPSLPGGDSQHSLSAALRAESGADGLESRRPPRTEAVAQTGPSGRVRSIPAWGRTSSNAAVSRGFCCRRTSVETDDRFKIDKLSQMATPVRDRHARRREQTRAKLVEAASTLIARQGVDNTRINEIVVPAEVRS